MSLKVYFIINNILAVFLFVLLNIELVNLLNINFFWL